MPSGSLRMLREPESEIKEESSLIFLSGFRTSDKTVTVLGALGLFITRWHRTVEYSVAYGERSVDVKSNQQVSKQMKSWHKHHMIMFPT